MPHIIVKLATGRPLPLKQALSDRLAAVVTQVLDVPDASVSVAIEEVEPADWARSVYIPDIQAKSDRVYKKPGYDPFA
jgi:4-oxalocrotonate tautomerase